LSEAGSGIEGMRQDSGFARYVAERLTQEGFTLVDVGCAGGLAGGWRAFGDRLSALAFDANAEEIARLSAAETNSKVRYVGGWVGMPDDHPLKRRIGTKAYWHHWPAGRLSYERSHDIRRARQEGQEPRALEAYFRDEVLAQDWSTEPGEGFDLDYARSFERFAPDGTGAGPGPVIHLPPYLQAAGFYDADFLKLDIDGPDYEVLRSMSDLLAQPSLLGVSLEVCFYGSHDANDNSFHNMDRLMREKGFDLFGLSVRTYASAALPWPYLDAHPSMTTGGRPVQGDALYLRDLGSRVRRDAAAELSAEKLAKTAALLALFTLPDYAAEMLIVHRQRLSALIDVDHGLDLLAEEIQQDNSGAPMAYRDYIRAFEAEDPTFFDRYGSRYGWMQDLIRTATAAPLVQDKVAALEGRLEESSAAVTAAHDQVQAMKAQLQAAQASAAEAAGRLAHIEGSTMWRLTAPLRRALSALKRR
jgi:hypothetical protein